MEAEGIVTSTLEQIKKPCSKCGEEKRLDEFSPHADGKYGRQAACLKCESKRRSAYKKSHPHITKAAGQRATQRRKERYPHDAALRDRCHLSTKKARIKRVYNLSHAEFLAMQERQAGLCAICGKPETVSNQWGILPLAIDHNHTTGAVRGLLCNKCNVKLKTLEDEVYMVPALAYLERYRVE